MGCCHVVHSDGRAALVKEGRKLDFREEYKVGNRLGEGSFGTVFECRKRIGDDKAVYAVKMMEHQSCWWGSRSASQEAQWQMFAQEFQMLKKVQHPHLIRMVGVFLDDYFVYFVMDRYDSNLIQAVLPILKASSTGLPAPVLAEITDQMLRSIAYLHEVKIIHRDVKADNYLVDGTEFGGRSFKVVLTDLSTAMYLEDGIFLKDMVGTREYWAPELIGRSYRHKVDVWAVGVIYWCMITAKFPFSTMQERFTKKLARHPRMTAEQFDLVEGMLHKNPELRLSAEDGLAHKWVVSETNTHRISVRAESLELSVKPGEDDKQEVQDESQAKGFGATRANIEVDEKRVLEKMKLADERFKQGERIAVSLEDKLGDLQDPSKQTISVAGKQRGGESKQYQWWSWERCVQRAVPDIQTECTKSMLDLAANADFATLCSGDVVVGEPANADYLEVLFRSHHIDISKFGVGEAKPLTSLFQELHQHECCLLLREDRLIRLVDLVVLRILSSSGKYLVEATQIFPDGRRREVQRLPAVMCRAKGKGLECALLEIGRLLKSEIGTTPEVVLVNTESGMDDVNTEIHWSQSYPGLESIYRRFFFNASLNQAAPAAKLASIGLPDASSFETSLSDGTRVTWEWWDLARCQTAGLPVAPKTLIHSDFEGFQQISCGSVNEKSMVQLLQKHKVNTELFGSGEARTIAQLVTEVNSGETWLYEKPDRPGELRRYLEILIVKVRNSHGAFLIETAHTFGEGRKRARNLLPATKVRPFEDKIWAVRRLLCELDIPFATARTRFGPRRKEQTPSPSYPNIVTIYLKQVVEVELEDIDITNLEAEDLGSAKWCVHDKL